VEQKESNEYTTIRVTREGNNFVEACQNLLMKFGTNRLPKDIKLEYLSKGNIIKAGMQLLIKCLNGEMK
jgi:hypothetical protein